MLDPETSFVCVECGITYTMAEKEYLRFKELATQNPEFRMPKRCAECRRLRRLQQAQTNVQAPITQQTASYRRPALQTAVKPVAVATVQAPAPEEPVTKPAEETSRESSGEISFVLATKDFDDLVNGVPVVWRGIKVILADIGFSAMRRAIDDAELEKAKKLVKANGH